jgi:hypothetical protein
MNKTTRGIVKILKTDGVFFWLGINSAAMTKNGILSVKTLVKTAQVLQQTQVSLQVSMGERYNNKNWTP